MYGNVFEWVQDWYEAYSDKPVKDPRGPTLGEKKVRRGGSWESRAAVCSSGFRRGVDPERRDQENGFRILREIR